ncbi:MAG: superoxide dismutase, Ni [Candidatus Aenigmarchaeota archaeon]|nr:superoxide dismutase, Ni [Candidatus Aenigmarchaeota archaeon]
MLYKLFGFLDKLKQSKIAYAHCDVPCGIYDPHLAQLAAHTVIRMNMLISELPPIVPSMAPEQRKEALHKLSRYIATKEESAELCKKEIRILWGDYFKPEHLQKYPQLHELVWKAMKLGSKVRQEINMQASEELLEAVNKIADIFWQTKGKETARAKADFYPTGRETVYPKL